MLINIIFFITLIPTTFLTMKWLVKKLIIFQKLSLLKRAILTNNNSFAIKLIGDYELFRYFPVAYTKCIIALIFPSWVFNSIRKYI